MEQTTSNPPLNDLDSDSLGDIYNDENGTCRCDDCETYFNEDVTRPIIEVSPEDYQRAMTKFNEPAVIQRRSRFRPCRNHHFVEKSSDLDPAKQVETPSQQVIICKVEHVMVFDIGDTVGSKYIKVCYRYPNCQVKCDFTLKPNHEVELYAWGACILD